MRYRGEDFFAGYPHCGGPTVVFGGDEAGRRGPGIAFPAGLRHFSAWLLLTLWSVAVQAVSGELPLEGDAYRIETGQEHTASHLPGEQIRYVLETGDTEAVLVRVVQIGLDIVLTHERPDGSITTINSELRRDEEEILVIPVSDPGLHTIVIASDEFTGGDTGHRISVTAIDPEHESVVLEAYRSVMRATMVDRAAGDRNWKYALAMYLRALTLWQSRGDSRQEAATLYGIASMQYWGPGDWGATADYAARAAAAYRLSGNMGLASNALGLQAAGLIEMATEIGDSNITRSLYKQAHSLFLEAQGIQESLGHAYDAAQSINNLGLTRYYQGEWDKARIHWAEAADRFQLIHEWGDEQRSLANLGVLEIESARYRAAISAFSRILDILPPDSAQRLRADTLDNRARALLGDGDYDAALRDYDDALEIHETLDNIEGQGRSLSGIASSYRAQGELDLAGQYYERALSFRRRAKDGRGQFSTLRLLGDVERELGNFEGALEFHRQALAIATTGVDMAKARIAIARDLNSDDQPGEALPVIGKAVRLAREADAMLVLADALSERGVSRLGLSWTELARKDLKQARDAYEQLATDEGLARSLYLLAIAARQEDKLAEAIELTGTAINHVERVRGKLGIPESRGTYLGTHRAPYELQISLAMDLAARSGDALADRYRRVALSTAERARARMMVDLINEADIDVNRGITPSQWRQRLDLYERLSEIRYRRSRQIQAAGSDELEELKASGEALDRVQTELRVLEAKIRRASPHYAALTDPTILDATGMQDLLDSDTLLIQYAIGDERSFVWSVTDEWVRAASVPVRASIDPLVRDAIETLRIYPSDEEARRHRDELLALVAEAILEPVEGLQDRRRIIVVADGILQYLPFSVLPLSTAAAPEPGRLIDTHEVIGVSSMSSLALRRGIRDDDPVDRGRIAIFAAPAAPDPKRGTDSGRGAGSSDRALVRKPGALDALPPLLRAEEEGRTIAALAGSGQSMLALGHAASRERVLGMDLSSYRYIHFASHSVIDTRYPALSALILSADGSNGGIRAGLLPVHEISRLNLNAELVVLSACDTALGREIRGEGMLGLTQSFFHAGSRRVLASLWWVPDHSTSVLMEQLYRGLLQDSLTPAAALRKAQLAIRAERRWVDPYFWGAFVLQGDW